MAPVILHPRRFRLAFVIAAATALLPQAARAVAPSTPGSSRLASGEALARLVARAFVGALADRKLTALVQLCELPFSLDGHVVHTFTELERRLLALGNRYYRQRLRLRQLAVLRVDQMRKRFGPPPRRLSASVRPNDRIALFRLTRGGLVAVLRSKGPFWRVVALSD